MIIIKYIKKPRVKVTGDENECAAQFGAIVKTFLEECGHKMALGTIYALAKVLPRQQIISLLDEVLDTIDDPPQTSDCEIIYPNFN